MSAAKRGLALTVSAVLALTAVAVTPTPSDAQTTEYVEFNFLNSAWLPPAADCAPAAGAATNCRIERVGAGDLTFPEPGFSGVAAGRLRLDAWLADPVFVSAVPVDGTAVGTAGQTVTWPTGNPTYTARIVGDMTLDPNGGTFIEQLGFVPNSSQSRTQSVVIDGSGRLVITDLWNRTAVDLEVPHRPGWAFRGWDVPHVDGISAPQPTQTGHISVQVANHPRAGATLTPRWEQFADSPNLLSAVLSADRRTVTLEFDADIVRIGGTCNRLFAFESTDATFGIRDAGTLGAPWDCTYSGSTVEITPHLAYEPVTFAPVLHPGLDASVTSLRVAFVGGNNTLRPAANASSRLHHTEFISVTLPPRVSFDRNGASGATPDEVVDGSGDVTLPSLGDRSDSKFAGWFDGPSGGTRVGGAGDTFTPTGDMTLYAQWEATISHISHGGSSVPDVIFNINTGSPYVLPSASKSGENFDGWWTSQTGGTQVGKAGDPLVVTGDVTLHAQWLPEASVPVEPSPGPVPTEVPSGEGPMPMPLALLLAGLVSVAGAVLVGRRALEVG